PLLPDVAEAMRPFLTEVYGNPASGHAAGRRARRAIEDARERTAALLGAHPDEVVFTSGATEANNLALLGLCGDPPAHLLASPVAPPPARAPLPPLAGWGSPPAPPPVDGGGLAPAGALGESLRPQTRQVAVMLANHETGAVQPVRELAASAPGGVL